MTIEDVASAIDAAETVDARVALIRRIPEQFGIASHKSIYAEIARRVYVPFLAPDFAYVHWREDYELPAFQASYDRAFDLTEGFAVTTSQRITEAIRMEPRTLRVFRVLLGYTVPEFAATTAVLAEQSNISALTPARIKGIEAGKPITPTAAQLCADAVVGLMGRTLFPNGRRSRGPPED